MLRLDPEPIIIERHISSRTNSGIKICVGKSTRDGLVNYHREFVGHSKVANFYRFLYYQTDFDGSHANRTYIDLTGAGDSTAMYPYTRGGTGHLNGILVGTGNTAVAIDDYDLATRVAHGTGAGQLTHSSHIYTVDRSTSPSQAYWERTFTNDSGGSIVIAETGLAMAHFANSSNDTSCYLIARDVLGSTITVNDTEVLTVSYTISMSDGTYNMGWLLEDLTSNNTTSPMKDLNSATDSVSASTAPFSLSYDQGLLGGIHVGTDNTAFDYSDNDLGARIDYGSSTGQLLWGASMQQNFNIDTGTDTITWDATRTFDNESGATININELGIIGSTNNTTNGSYLLDREVLGAPFALLDQTGKQAKWNFTYTLT